MQISALFSLAMGPLPAAALLNPQTGDRNSDLLVIVMAALVISAVVIVALTVSSKKKKNKRKGR